LRHTVYGTVYDKKYVTRLIDHLLLRQ